MRQVYANVLAGACGDLVHDATTSDGENLSSCWGTPAPTASCTSGSDATVRWYGEVQYYESAATGYSNTVGKDIGHFTQVQCSLFRGLVFFRRRITHRTSLLN